MLGVCDSLLHLAQHRKAVSWQPQDRRPRLGTSVDSLGTEERKWKGLEHAWWRSRAQGPAREEENKCRVWGVPREGQGKRAQQAAARQPSG